MIRQRHARRPANSSAGLGRAKLPEAFSDSPFGASAQAHASERKHVGFYRGERLLQNPIANRLRYFLWQLKDLEQICSVLFVSLYEP